MTKTFTRNDVLRYFYSEVSKTEKQEIEEFLSCDKILMEYYCKLISVEKQVNRNLEKPRRTSVQNILAYSKSLCLQN